MEYINEQLSTPICDRCDVLIAGGGVAGIAAALAASRNGADVLLLEKQFMLGGLATAGLVTIYLPLCDGMGHQVIYGIAEELLKLSIRHGWEDKHPGTWLEGVADPQCRYEVQYNPQLFALAAEELLLKEGVRILYGTAVCSVAKNDNRIDTVIIENKTGRSAIRVGAVIDCTGDADVCNMAGEHTALYYPGNILAAWHYYVNKNGYALRIMGASDIPVENAPLCSKIFQGIDGKELSDVTLLSHQHILAETVRKQQQHGYYMPVTIATIPQVRMSRRLSGCATVTLDNAHKHLHDSVGLFGNWKKRGPVYSLPFRSLCCSQVSNLLAAGRCISADDDMWDVTRVIPVCALSGQAAGTAAAMTHHFPSIDLTTLQNKLQQDGVRLWPEQIPGLR